MQQVRGGLKAKPRRIVTDAAATDPEPELQIRVMGLGRLICWIHFVVDLLQTGDLVGLRPLCSLNDIELNLIPFFKAFVALALDGTVVNEDVGSTVVAEEAVALCVVEPLYDAFVLCQLRDSLSCCSRTTACREVRVLQR